MKTDEIAQTTHSLQVLFPPLGNKSAETIQNDLLAWFKTTKPEVQQNIRNEIFDFDVTRVQVALRGRRPTTSVLLAMRVRQPFRMNTTATYKTFALSEIPNNLQAALHAILYDYLRLDPKDYRIYTCWDEPKQLEDVDQSSRLVDDSYLVDFPK